MLLRRSCSSARPRPSIPPPSLNLANSARRLFPLEISPSPISFGVLDAGKSGERLVPLRNPQSEPVYLERIETSCPCIKVMSAPIQIGPGETKNLIVRFDPSAEPNFRGGLSVEIAGFGKGERVVFRSKVNLEVRSALTERTGLETGDLAPTIQETSPCSGPRRRQSMEKDLPARPRQCSSPAPGSHGPFDRAKTERR
ncbi:MAG: DUF1573 domain-containing protein [Isosphaerales bacterium]